MSDRYILIEGISTGTKIEQENFLARVNEKIDDGYEPCGSLIITTSQSISGKIIKYTQPMLRKD